MSFENLKPPSIDEEQSDSTFLRKEDLDGQVIAVDIVDYDPQYEGKFGKNPRITVDMIVCTGEHKGERQDNTYFSNNLAKQLHAAAGGGGSTVVKVTSGNSKYGTKWYGVEDVTDAEYQQAAEVVAGTLQPASGSKPPF